MYIADGDYIKDIEVNDLRNRYTLTKGSTQKMVNTLVMSTDTPRRPCRGASKKLRFLYDCHVVTLVGDFEAYIVLI